MYYFAGVLQILFGLFKLGFFANFIPNNVILGLLAAIGVILIATQLPYLFGLSDFHGNRFGLQHQMHSFNVLMEALHLLAYSVYFNFSVG